tara:strand:- start:6 stop:1595 length:1590 start_codon:yes stop_codon:yes gene_type:complete
MSVTATVETQTVPAKFRVYPNQKNQKVLNNFMGARRFIWNRFLWVQKNYYDKLNSYVLEQIDQTKLEEIKAVFQELEGKTDKESRAKVKEATASLKAMKKEVQIPSEVGRSILKELAPDFKDDVIEELVNNYKDSSIANRNLSAVTMRKQLKYMKKAEGTEWLSEVHSCVLGNACLDLDTAWKKFFKDESNRSGMPRFKHATRDKNGFCLDGGAYQLDLDNGYIRSKKFKLNLKFKKHREVFGEPKSITITRDKVGDYWAAINFRQDYDVELLDIDSVNDSNSIGIDMGMKDDFAILSNGKTYKNPKFLKRHERRKKIHSRRLSRKTVGSNSFEKNLVEKNKLERKVSRLREDFLHKITDEITKDPKVKAIFVEDLNVAGMISKNKAVQDENGKYLKNNQSVKRAFNKAATDASMGKFLMMLKYKAQRSGKPFVRIDRYFASSKTCSCCGHKNDDLKVSDQHWTCESCGTKHERNHNASKNIQSEGIKLLKETKEVFDLMSKTKDEKKAEKYKKSYNKLKKTVNLFGNI